MIRAYGELQLLILKLVMAERHDSALQTLRQVRESAVPEETLKAGELRVHEARQALDQFIRGNI